MDYSWRFLIVPWVRRELSLRKLDPNTAEAVIDEAMRAIIPCVERLGPTEIEAAVLRHIDAGRPPGGWPHEFLE